MRQLILDTETTGLNPEQGHRLIEIAAMEMQNRRLTGKFRHYYLNPEREIDEAATNVHGMTWAMLQDKPLFADIVDDFLEFVRGGVLIIHNAPFDLGFIDSELQRLSPSPGNLSQYIDSVEDTLKMARNKYPGQKNSLDHLVKRLDIPARDRRFHGALLDSEILADVYLAMTGGQTGMNWGGETGATAEGFSDPLQVRRLVCGDRPALPIISPDAQELALHQAALDGVDKASKGQCLWSELLRHQVTLNI